MGNAQHNECMISGFRLEADVHCLLQGYYAANSGNSLQTFGARAVSCPQMLVRNYHYSLRNSPEECNSQHNGFQTKRLKSG